VAVELIDESLRGPEQTTYRCLVAVEEGDARTTVFGYLCYGLTPMTQGTYDLYWIVVDPDHRKRGVGRALLQALDETLCQAGGRVVRVETSSSEMYRAADAFYRREGFLPGGLIPGFYGEQEDLVVYYKPLAPRP